MSVQTQPLSIATYPAPSDPTPRGFDVEVPVAGTEIAAHVDIYSDRLRCDHPDVSDGRALGEALKQEASERGRGRIVVLARADLAEGLESASFETEAVMPGFYDGAEDCAVLGYAVRDERAAGGFTDEVARVDALLGSSEHVTARPRFVQTERAAKRDAAPIAALIDETFAQYPTPSGVPDYIGDMIESGVPFRVVRDGAGIVACASADLVPEARTAELTDCATLPICRGRGYMQAILSDLMGDLRDRGYPTAFTLARARIPGVNLAFERLGFELRGRMRRSCRIGGGLEDMNVWSRSLALEA